MRALFPTTLLAFCFACSGAQISSDDAAKADFHYRLARNYYSDRNIAMAQRELHEALKLDPGHAEAHHLKGFMLMGLADPDGAAAEFRAALASRPDLHEARNNLGSVLISQGRYEEAIQVLKPLTEDALYPTPAFAHGNLGWAYFQLGDVSTARRHMEMAVFLNPRFCLGYNNLGILYKDMGNRSAAREAFEKAVKNCPKYAEPWYYLGVLYQEANEPGPAQAAFEKCAEFAAETRLGQRCKVRL